MSHQHYATAEETASVMRQATPDEKWLHEQLDRIDPHRHEMGSAGDTPALVKLVFELKEAKTQLQGEAKVMRELLEKSVNVIATIDEQDAYERSLLWELRQQITDVVRVQLVRP